MTRSLGTDDYPVCVNCGSPIHAARRGPGLDNGAPFERQSFECPKCHIRIERSASLLPYIDPMREPVVQGWLKGGLVAPN
jgi:predicted RNA-binding Zn-ribbon protein involved in translation (DUF1610 family)